MNRWVEQQHGEVQRPVRDIVVHLSTELENKQDELERRQRSLEHVKYLLEDKEVEMQRVLAVSRERMVVL